MFENSKSNSDVFLPYKISKIHEHIKKNHNSYLSK